MITTKCKTIHGLSHTEAVMLCSSQLLDDAKHILFLESVMLLPKENLDEDNIWLSHRVLLTPYALHRVKSIWDEDSTHVAIIVENGSTSPCSLFLISGVM